MRLYMAGFFEQRASLYLEPEITKTIFVLGSYFYINSPSVKREFDPTICRDFILDSGAFTFVYGNKNTGSANWKEYIRQYAHFIKEYNIKKYVELDIDSIVGYDRVLDYRKMLEDNVGWPSIPVYHVNRTEEQFANDCQGHPFVAYGSNDTISTQETYDSMEKIIKVAHDCGSRIHAFGYGDPQEFIDAGLQFDSADATTWIKSSNFGLRFRFDKEQKKLIKGGYSRFEQMRPTCRERLFSLSAFRQYMKYAAQNIDVVWPEDVDFPHCFEDDMTYEELKDRYSVIKKRKI